LRAATLACGGGAAVSHRSAAALLGLLDRSPVVIDVIAPGQSGRGIDGICLHRVAPPGAEEAGTCKTIPCTSPARTLVDLAGILGERSLRRTVERAAVLQILDIGAIERVLAIGRRRGTPTLRAALAGWQSPPANRGTAHPPLRPLELRSDLEARLLGLVGAARLPTPLCNQAILASGKRIEVDFLWLGSRLIVETDGRGFHDNPVAFERDRIRDRALHLAGYRVVRFTHEQIGREPDAVVAAIRRLLTMDVR
jgi:very-short-patch-repair endonuclease